MRRLSPVFAASALLLTASLALAEEAQPPAAPPTATVRMEAVEIKGEYENPDVFFIIPRRKGSMDVGNLTIDYSAEIAAPLLPNRFASRFQGRGEGGERK